MKRFALTVAVLLAVGAANAEIYQWKDKNGKTIFSDTPPVGNVTDQKKISSDSGNNAVTPKTTADKDLEFRKRQKDSQDSAEKLKKEQDAAAALQENCTNARRYLKSLESGERIASRDEKGDRYFMDDAQRTQETAKAQQAVQTSCK